MTRLGPGAQQLSYNNIANPDFFLYLLDISFKTEVLLSAVCPHYCQARELSPHRKSLLLSIAVIHPHDSKSGEYQAHLKQFCRHMLWGSVFMHRRQHLMQWSAREDVTFLTESLWLCTPLLHIINTQRWKDACMFSLEGPKQISLKMCQSEHT